MKTITQAPDGTVCLHDDGVVSFNLADKDKEIILAYAGNNMRAKWAARQLGMHWNVVYYRLDRIWDKTGLDPHNFYDLGKLVRVCREEG